MKCPYCGKVPFNESTLEWAHSYAENYGSKTFNIKCEKCKEMIAMPVHRYTKIGELRKSSATIED